MAGNLASRTPAMISSNSAALQAKNPQLEPLDLNPSTGEPFLHIEDFDDIIITPMRWDDAPTSMIYMNDPAVYHWMSGLPIPYLACGSWRASSFVITLIWTILCSTADAERWCNHVIPPQQVTLAKLEKARDQPMPITLDACPVNSIQKVNKDGADTFIGSVDIHRFNLGELALGESGEYTDDMSCKEENQKRNGEREVGDLDIVWEFGGAFLSTQDHPTTLITHAAKGADAPPRRLPSSGISWSWDHDRLRQEHPY